MDTISLRGFYEKETREAFDVCMFEDGSEDHFEQLVPYIEHLTTAFCNALRCDGLWVTRYVDGVVPVHTAEFVPGRPTVYWHGYECC